MANTAATKVSEISKDDPARLGGELAEQRRFALQKALDDHGLTPAALARKAGLSTPNLFYNLLSGRSISLSHETYERIRPYLPGSDLRILLRGARNGRVASCAGEADLTEIAKLSKHRGRVIQQLSGSVRELKKGVAEFQGAITAWSIHIALLEAKLLDLCD